MSIVNYGELKAAVKDWAKREDIDNRIPDFIRATHIKLVEAVGPLVTVNGDQRVDEMVEDGDNNAYLNYNPYGYLHGALYEAYMYLRDFEMAAAHQNRFQAELQNLYMCGAFDNLVMASDYRC